MDKEENIRIQMRHFKMENVRLHGEVSRLSRYVSFLEEENRAIETEVRSECQATMDLLRYRIEVAEAKSEALGRKAESESRRADVAEALASERERRITELEEEVNRFKGLREVADAAKEGNMDYRDVLEVIKRRTFLRNSDATRFYLESKFAYGLSENRIIEMLKSMRTRIPQSSLNLWMHQIMAHLRERLEPLILAAIKRSKFTNNDGTRLLVRSGDSETGDVSYKIEYIQAALSMEKRLVAMLYEEGSRGHELQEEKIFRDSSIECFVADRLSVYQTIVEDLQDQRLKRQACWFHGRHYLVDAYMVDHRVEDIIKLINLLFYIERVFQDEDDTSPEARLAYRRRWSKRIVDRIMRRLEKIREAGSEYGTMVHRAVNYILDDREAFERFLSDGRVDMHNNAIERCFRHIAIGRRNWLHTGSHESAQNIAFMFGLYESCKLNNLDFGHYIEDILTRMVNGEGTDESFIPCNYVSRPLEEETAA